jgi:hypothetical protein
LLYSFCSRGKATQFKDDYDVETGLSPILESPKKKIAGCIVTENEMRHALGEMKDIQDVNELMLQTFRVCRGGHGRSFLPLNP